MSEEAVLDETGEGVPQRQAEQALLALMLHSGARAWARAAVDAKWFFEDLHRVAFEAASDWDIAHGDIELEVLTWSREVAKRMRRPWALVAQGLTDCLFHSASPVNVSAYAMLVRDDWERREVRRRATEISVRASERTADTTQLVSDAVDMASIIAARQSETVIGSDELLIAAEHTDRGTLRTGFAELDGILKPLAGGNLVTVGARTSVGKSSFAIDVARNALRDGVPVGFVTTEMTPSEIWERLRALSVPLTQSAYFYFPRQRPSVRQIEAEARHWGGIGLLVIDHLQHLVGDSGKRHRSRYEELTDVVHDLKALARSLQVPVLMLSQLHRVTEGKPDRPPGLSDLKETGAIEEDSDKVILLHRPGYYDPKADQSKAMAFVAKQRNGRTGFVDLTWRPELSSFASVALDPWEQQSIGQ